jgi:hypothetical protein
MKTIFLIVLEDFVPSISIWKKIFSDFKYVKIVNNIPEECDALVVSPSRCDAFGCPAGKKEENIGVMYIYDQHELPEKYRYHPRFLISNAVWKKDPHIIEAVEKRAKAFTKAISEFNKNFSLPIKKPAIKTETLGFWQDYSDEIQIQAINALKVALTSVFRKSNE